MERVKLGSVGVDSGQLIIADPCYHQIGTEGRDLRKLHTQIGHEGVLGIIFDSGLGDGSYEVWADVIDIGTQLHPDKRIARIEIVFIDEDDEYIR